jgi:hypothetical protein
MRALRDFNLPKIVSDDNPVFLGLISDLFPSLDVPRKRELEFEKAVKHAACDLKLQPEESFVLKVVQLEELLYVRHSVFIGNVFNRKQPQLVIFICNIILVSYFFIGKVISSIKSQIDHTVLSTI